MNFIIFDLEATCWSDKWKHRQEVIEIGALKVDENKIILGEFNAFIKPILHPHLSDFCTQLTSIEQHCINSSHNFPAVIEQFKNWIDLDNDYLLCSWGFYDRKQLIADCTLHELEHQWCNRHISLKHQHASIRMLELPLGLQNVLKMEKMEFEGIIHRGIDDARNIVRIFLRYFNEWKCMDLNQ